MNDFEKGPKPETNETSEKVIERIARIGEVLEQTRLRTVEALRPSTALELDEDQVYACFELFHAQDYGMGYNMIYAEKDNAGLSVLDIQYGPYSENEDSFIPELDDLKQVDQDVLTGKESKEFNELHQEQLFKWFSECWFAAGGEESRVPTYFSFGKEYRVRDLATGEVMSEEEAARRNGFNRGD